MLTRLIKATVSSVPEHVNRAKNGAKLAEKSDKRDGSVTKGRLRRLRRSVRVV